MTLPTPPEQEQPKSCINCPSFVPESETLQHFQRATNIPLCGRFGTPLGMPTVKGGALTELWEATAAKCGRHGAPRPDRAEVLNTFLVSAAPEVMMKGMPNEEEKSSVQSCQQCANFIDERRVMEKWGIVGGLCAASGRILFGNRLAKEARACEVRRPGMPNVDIESMLPLPQFKKLANIFLNGGDVFEEEGERVEPRDYPTDKPVSANSAKAGIRAWRKVVNPRNSDKFVYLPIYADSAFSPEELSLIPRTGDEEHPELYRDHGGVVFRVAMAWVGLDETPALWGPAGTGKTELFRHMAWLMNLPFRRISITASSEVDDLMGKAQYSPEKGTYYVYGRLPIAWQSPCVLCLDEPNVGPPEVWQAIRPLTDNSKQMVLDQNESERIPRHDDCYLGMAMNPAWDIRNIGAQQLADADGSRLGHVLMQLPPPVIERQIIKARCELDGYAITNSELEMVMKAAIDIRGLSEDGTIPISWGVRNQIKVARALQFLDPVEAYKFAVTDSLEPTVAEVVLDVLNSVVPK